MASAKGIIRWDWIETKWQEGILSNRAIATAHKEQFGVQITEAGVRKRALQHGWQRDLDVAVRRETRRKLAEGELPVDVLASSQNSSRSQDAVTCANEVRTIEAAADAAVRIIQEHRYHALRLHGLATKLEMYAAQALPLNEDGTPALAYEPGELKDIGSVITSVSTVRAQAVRIERQAYHLDENEKRLNAPGTLDALREYLADGN